MFIFNFIKSPRYFYSTIAVIFIFFVLLILYAGKQVYESERGKLFAGKVSELHLTKHNFETRLEETAVEMRRLSKLIQQLDLIENPKASDINNFFNDFLFDHSVMSIIIEDNSDTCIMVESSSYPARYKSLLSKEPAEILSMIPQTENTLNRPVIQGELDLISITKSLANDIGDTDKTVTFIFTPDLILHNTPSNYAVFSADSAFKFMHEETPYPGNFTIDTAETYSVISDTKAVFYAQMSEPNSSFYLTELADTSGLKSSLLAGTVVTTITFSIFFTVIILIIYIRNIHMQQIINTQKSTVVCLANLAEFKDNETADHLERTRHYGALLTKHLKKTGKYNHIISKDYLENIGFASVLHDIGKVGVPDEILKKPAKLTYEEFEEIKKHPEFAKSILSDLVKKHNINDTFFDLAYNISAYHHEFWDGSGYPDKLSGEAIPLEARIFAICDVYDALRSERVYKPPFSHEDSMAIINENCGTQFDPAIVDAFNKCSDQFRHIHNTYEIFYNKISYDTFGNNRRELKMEWSEKLATNIKEIDEQHKVLIDKINDLIKAILAGEGRMHILRVLNFLEEYVIVHFETEEKIMRDTNFKDIKYHIKAHETFHATLQRILRTVKENGVSHETMEDIETNLITWLLTHITEMDSKIKT